MTTDVLDETFRREWPKILATLIRYTGSPELAEDAVQEAFLRASASRDRELLINPAAWITTVAKRIAMDAVRRDATLRKRLPMLAEEPQEPQPAAVGGDDRLELLFLACSPSFTAETRLALALRFVCGVPTADIADAMLAAHTALSARITRAKRQIEREGIRFVDLETVARTERLDDVLSTIHLLYTVGHTAVDGATLDNRPVAATAIELARALVRVAPDDLEAAGLLALLLLTDARSPSRTDRTGEVVTLELVDRTAWNHALVREGLELATRALPGAGRFALEAGISGMHSDAPTWEATDWESIRVLYDRLVERWPSPSAQLARVVAGSYRRGGLATALAELDALRPSLSGASARQAMAVRADLLRRLGRTAEARAAYVRARSQERNAPVRNYFGRRIDELDPPTSK
ncbi:MAG: DUF6596 domain-containing protein [Rhodoglobus sp.]